MANLAEIVRADKIIIDTGKWATGHVSRSAFPLSKARTKHYRFGPEYSWRVVRFECLGLRCRVLILFNGGKEICRFTLAVDVQEDLAVLCNHEYHADHRGWHCHLTWEGHDRVTPGVVRTGQRRWPHARAEHSRKEFGVSLASALSHVAARYRFEGQGGLL